MRLAKPIGFLRGELLELREADDVIERRRVPVRATDVVERREATKLVASPTLPPSSSWWHLAACRGKPVSWWFPMKGDVWLARAAVAVCSTCGVREQCLAEAMLEEADASPNDVTGIRGALTPSQRLALARSIGRQADMPSQLVELEA